MRSLLFPWSSIYGLEKFPQYASNMLSLAPFSCPQPPFLLPLLSFNTPCLTAPLLLPCINVLTVLLPSPLNGHYCPCPNTFLTQPGSATPHQAAQTPDASLPWLPLHCFSPAPALTQHTGLPLPPIAVLRYLACPTQTSPSSHIRIHLPSPSPLNTSLQ